jgi:hypothetical protein
MVKFDALYTHFVYKYIQLRASIGSPISYLVKNTIYENKLFKIEILHNIIIGFMMSLATSFL